VLRADRKKLQKIREKIENVGAPTFFGGVYPPVFAYVGERKEFGRLMPFSKVRGRGFGFWD
jgi:hypothetical protein